MRSAILLLALVTVACGSSSRAHRTRLAHTPDPGHLDDSRPVDKRPGDVSIHADTGEDLSWLAPIYFDVDSIELSPAARDTLAHLGEWLGAHRSTKLTIEGHCDEQGTTEYNIGLGQRRAQAMAEFLARLGTERSRLTTVSFGSERPAVDGHDELAWSKNRRGELRVAK